MRVLETVLVPLLVAFVTAGGAVLAVWLKRFDERNTTQHNKGASLLEHLSGQVQGIDNKVDRLDERIDDMTLWQAEHEKRHMIDDTKRDR